MSIHETDQCIEELDSNKNKRNDDMFWLSTKEKEMFDILDMKHEDFKRVGVILLYTTACYWCFLHKIDNKASDSLRRCMNALNKAPFDDSIPKRLTPEFDALIEI